MRMARLAGVLGMCMLLVMLAGATAAQSGTPVARGDGASRASPLPVGQVGTVGAYDVRVVDVIPDATDVVLATSERPDPPEAGHVFFIIGLEVMRTGAATGAPRTELGFRVVDDQNRDYPERPALCGALPDDAVIAPTLAQGESVAFKVCWSVPAAAAGALVLSVAPAGTADDDDRVWFALEDAATSGASTLAFPRASSAYVTPCPACASGPSVVVGTSAPALSARLHPHLGHP